VPDAVPIGKLRWRVTLANRLQAPEATNAGILESYQQLITVYADVQQTDTPVTHMITMRWVDYLSNTQAILRRTILRDNTQRYEIFRVRRIIEMGGRKRMVMIEAEFEQFIINGN
jgi:hypothetical protein